MENVKEIVKTIEKRLNGIHIGVMDGESEPVLLISADYPGVWLEHVYDSLMYARLYEGNEHIAENTVRLFIKHQTPEGQLPALVAKNGSKSYNQIQECVSFARLAYDIYSLRKDKAFLREIYNACSRWDEWLCRNRMTLGKGLIEQFVGFDTGHDNSSRADGLTYRGNYRVNGAGMNASVFPPDEKSAPLIAVDMNCNLYASRRALARMARELGCEESAKVWESKAREIKNRLFEYCLDRDDAFFYDLNKDMTKRKYLSCTVFHLFMERVLDPTEDKALIDEIYDRHINNEKEFKTPYPYPSMAICDKGWRLNSAFYCWSYFSQGLIALRATLWMDEYGYSSDLDRLCEIWLKAWTKCYDKVKLGQELHPITGEPSKASEWYSSCMLFYIYSARRLHII